MYLLLAYSDDSTPIIDAFPGTEQGEKDFRVLVEDSLKRGLTVETYTADQETGNAQFYRMEGTNTDLC